MLCLLIPSLCKYSALSQITTNIHSRQKPLGLDILTLNLTPPVSPSSLDPSSVISFLKIKSQMESPVGIESPDPAKYPSPSISTMITIAQPAPIIIVNEIPESLKQFLGVKPLISPVPNLFVPRRTLHEMRSCLRDGIVCLVDSMYAVIDSEFSNPRIIEKKAWAKTLTNKEVEWYFGE